jgi:hypothetical protein
VRHFSQIQIGNVCGLAMLNDLADVPFALERVGEIKPIGGTVQTICFGAEITVMSAPQCSGLVP